MITQSRQIIFQYKNKEISVSFKFSNRKTVGIAVQAHKKIEVTAPVGTDFAYIKRVINRKSKWIFKQLEKLEKYKMIEQKKQYAGGKTLKRLGREYMIKVIQIPDFEEENIVKEYKLVKVYVHNSSEKERIHLLIEDWYRNEAMVYLAKKFEQCYEKFKKYGLPKPLYYLRYMKRRWGSCTAKGNILLNPDIFQFPTHLIEYVIMHELCHLKHRDHSRKFYYFLDTVLPDWKERAKNLDSFLQV